MECKGAEILKKQNKNSTVVFAVTLTVLLIGTVVLFSKVKPHTGCRHAYTAFEQTVLPSDFSVGEKKKTCKKCGDTITERVRARVNLPQLYLDGDTISISKTSDAIMKAEYFDKGTAFNVFASVKNQGHTSMGYAKKNYTIKFYRDEARNDKYKVSLNGWQKTFKYCLKANFIDYSSARNIVSSEIWRDVTASREQLDSNIAELEFSGAIDGYPIALFINGEYTGLYTLNIPKDEDTYHIADEENEAMFVINSGFSDAAQFRALLCEEDKKAVFDLEYSYPEDAQWPYESLNKLLGFVINNDGEDFQNGAEQYLDIDAAIDYLITAYVLGVTDNFSKNMILLTYDGNKWIPDMYDLDTACGLMFDGSGYLEYDFSLPKLLADGTVSSQTDNLLWDRILNNYTQRFKRRYFELRAGILNTEKLINRYTGFISLIPEECYIQETVLYRDTPQKNISQAEQISGFLKCRCEQLDSIIEQF